jgi:starvation-inducible DNA-binding protein
MSIDIGMDLIHRQKIAEGLSKLLADSYTLYLKTHNFHWNVTGPHFNSLHQLFEEHYTELATAVDDIAERIRALDFVAPGSYSQFSKLTSIKESIDVPNWQDMIHQLIEAHETVVKTARSLLNIVDEAGDEVTQGLLGERMSIHEKTAWMLRSLLA